MYLVCVVGFNEQWGIHSFPYSVASTILHISHASHRKLPIFLILSNRFSCRANVAISRYHATSLGPKQPGYPSNSWYH